jgi:subtilisin family serine protease
MKKQYYYFIIAVLAASIVLPVTYVKAKSGPVFYDVALEKYQFAEALDMATQQSILPEIMPWNVDAVDVENTDNDGEGVYVAVLDTGLVSSWEYFFPSEQVDIAEELGKGFTHDIDYYTGAIGPLRDDRGFITDIASGHGTHVTSTIVGYNYNGMYWIKGVAPKVTIIPVLVLDAWEVAPELGGIWTGGTDEMISAGIYYVADLSETLDGPVIINMSLGGPTPSPMIKEAIDYAIDKGVIIVVSAGNDGYAGMGYPGAYSEVISCAAGGWSEAWGVDENGYLTQRWTYDVPEDFRTPDIYGNNHIMFVDTYSARPNKDLGQKARDLDVIAPGSSIVGPYKQVNSTAVAYYFLWGTSMSAPHVSGMAALVAQEIPYVEQKGMERILKNAAHGNPLPADGTLGLDPWGYYYFEWSGNEYGAGWLKGDQAVFVASATDMGLI